ncbi:uncharacterized protein MKK02DRAFT_39430 [Dioszegia hungarica]|uniref:Uncharacterized protein n=1 Tax=Dioszegia hungarica TaxID=4972 RepID=A0AA38HGM1_9TREE|nr:uncharacterized protein MKK02DRAFT_39430 [Dioszegia hungarica]KAI9639146.1 hypothetical protein MKK02DRAFT_39430 [Dioszegia hungarica]
MEGSAPSTELIEQQVEYLEGLVTSSYGAWLAFRQLNPDSHDYHRISQSITRLDPSTGESITMLLQAVEGFLTAPLTDPTRYHRSGSVMTFQKFLLTETGPGGFLEAFIHQIAVQDEYVRTSIIDKVMMLPEGTVDTLLGWNRKQRWQYITHNPDSQYTWSLVELSQIETWIIMGDDYDTVAVKMGGSPGTVQGRLNRQWKRIHPSILEGGHQSFARRGSRQAAQLYPFIHPPTTSEVEETTEQIYGEQLSAQIEGLGAPQASDLARELMDNSPYFVFSASTLGLQ